MPLYGRRCGSLIAFAWLISRLLLASSDVTPKYFSGDTSPSGRNKLRVVLPDGVGAKGGLQSLVIEDVNTGAERNLLDFPIHVDLVWSRDGRRLAVNDFGYGHRGNALVFDLGGQPDAVDLGRLLRAERPETSELFQNRDVFLDAQSWLSESSLTVRLHGQGAAYPRGFQRFYRFELGRGFQETGRGPVSLGLSGEKDYDAPEFEDWKAVLLDRSQPHGSRAHAMHEMVMHDALRGLGVVATLLDDRDEEVRHEAAEWLAIRGDRRGLDAMVALLKEPRSSYHAASRLGNSGKKEYAAPIATAVRRVLEASLRNGRWVVPSAEELALLHAGTVALARLGRAEDRELVLTVANSDPSFGPFELVALGFIDDPRSRAILWRWYEKLAGEGSSVASVVDALLPLSRLGDPVAIERMREIVKNRRGAWPPNQFPILAPPGSKVFGALRPRDAGLFAETVFEVASQDPEGPGTREAWEALGVMHPTGFGPRVLKLALSHRPHWKAVSRDLLNNVVIAIDPDLNSEFWAGFDVEQVPAMRGYKTLTELELGALLFRGSWYWIGE